MKPGVLARLRGRSRGGVLRKHLLLGVSGSIVIAGVRQLLSLGSGVILARVLAPAGYGMYAFAISVMGLLQIPALFGMNKLLAREVAAGEATGRWDLVFGLLRRSIQFVGLSTFIIALVAIGVLWLAPLHLSREGRVTFMLAVGYMVINSYATLATASLVGLRRVIVAQLPILIGRPALLLVGVAGIWLLFRGQLSPPTAMGANVAAATAMCAVSLVLAVRSFRARAPRVAPSFETRRWLTSALPFTLVGGMAAINAQTDLVMLGVLATSREVGIYRVAAVGAAVIPLVLAAVNSAIGPTLAGLHATGDRVRLARIVRLTALSGLAGGSVSLLVLVLWGHVLIRTIFGHAYLSAWLPLVILGLGQLTNAGMGPVGLVLNMTGHERDTFFGLAVSAVVNVALNAVMIPQMGVLGAATATAVSNVVWNVLLAWRVKRRLGFLPFGSPRVPAERQ